MKGVGIWGIGWTRFGGKFRGLGAFQLPLISKPWAKGVKRLFLKALKEVVLPLGGFLETPFFFEARKNQGHFLEALGNYRSINKGWVLEGPPYFPLGQVGAY